MYKHIFIYDLEKSLIMFVDQSEIKKSTLSSYLVVRPLKHLNAVTIKPLPTR